MTALVTGASGFVGAWLVAALAAEGTTVTAQMRAAPSALFVKLGLTNHPGVTLAPEADVAAVVARVQPSVVYHLAGFSQIGAAMKDPLTVFEANTRTTWLLLDALRQMPAPARCVVASTDSIYGETGGTPATEDDPPRATGPYEASKQMADLAARSFARTYGLPVTVARMGNVYGPGDSNGARIVPGVINAIRAGGVPQLRGGGRAVRSLLFVQDCIAGLRFLADRAGEDGVRGEVFNLSGDTPMTTLEIARKALAAFGRPGDAPHITEDAPGETSVKVSSNARLRGLGWAPVWTFEAGLAEIHRQWDRL